MGIGGEPDPRDLRASAGHDAVVVLNADRQAQAEQLRALDPQVRILQYRDLASVRSYDGDSAVVTGVTYPQAVREGWLALDDAGRPVEWEPYPGHYQTTVWNPGYRQVWVHTVTEQAVQPPWDGVLADNDLVTLTHYSDATLAGTTNHADTDRRLTAGIDDLLNAAGPALQDRDRDLVVNISEGRNDPARWADHSRYGGGLVEHFMAWSQNGRPDVVEEGGGEWLAEAELVGIGPRTLAITTAAAGDERTCLYGYASFLMFADPGDAWQCAPGGRYDRRYALPETDIPLGRPTQSAVHENQAWTRTFETGWVAVNPTTAQVVVEAPRGTRANSASATSELRLPALTGIVLPR